MIKNVLIIAGSVLVVSAIAYGVYEYISLKEENKELDVQITELRKQIDDAEPSLAAADFLAQAVLNRYDSSQVDEAAAEEVAIKHVEWRQQHPVTKPVLATLDGVPVFSGMDMSTEEMNTAHIRAQLKNAYIEGVAREAGKSVETVAAIFERFPSATEKLIDQSYHSASLLMSGEGAATDDLIGQAIQAMIDQDPEVEELNQALGELVNSNEAASA